MTKKPDGAKSPHTKTTGAKPDNKTRMSTGNASNKKQAAQQGAGRGSTRGGAQDRNGR